MLNILLLSEKQLNITTYSDFRNTFDTHYQQLCVYASGIVNDDFVAEDIVQEFFVSLWNSRHTFSVLLKSYLYKSVKNRCISWLRKQSCDNVYVDYQTDLGTAIYTNDSLEYNDLKKEFDKCVKDLPERCRQVFLLGRVEGLKQSDISEIMKISIRTIKVQMGKALNYLRSCISLNYEFR